MQHDLLMVLDAHGYLFILMHQLAVVCIWEIVVSAVLRVTNLLLYQILVTVATVNY